MEEEQEVEVGKVLVEEEMVEVTVGRLVMTEVTGGALETV